MAFSSRRGGGGWVHSLLPTTATKSTSKQTRSSLKPRRRTTQLIIRVTTVKRAITTADDQRRDGAPIANPYFWSKSTQRKVMDNDDCDVVITHEGHMDIRNSNNLDLNVEHDARSPKLSDVDAAKHELLNLGTEFESDEQAYSFYIKYAELVGFSVRKDWVNRSKVHGRVMSRKFTCSRQGYRKKDKRDANVKKHRKETRTGCLAHMVVTRQPNGKYRVTHFGADHNHEDVNLSKAQKLLELPLPGKVESNEVSETDSMKNSEIQSKLSFQLLDNERLIATRYKDMCQNILKISARAAVSDSAFEFAARQLDEVMQGVERILTFKPYTEAKDITASGAGAYASENEMANIDLDKSEFEVQDVDILTGAAETESIVPDRDQLNHRDEAIPSKSGGLSMHRSPRETVLSVACAPSTYILSPSPNPTCPLAQGLYPVEANHIVHNMYQTPNLTINQEPNPNMYEQQSFYSSQQHSANQVQFLQESLIRNQFQESMSNGTQLRQVMDHDNQNPHPPSVMHYNHRYRATGV
ncbi:unnamed protein product [Fraxinus pennsylvanica]|uniref:FAR1 domain-containing protein n=1 Tax=Fraxinus pennsylvanica TaxID=56036 RepID=A0AAD2DWS2_9LAMI|nr:unnamed protein product [Fraxinus pennsylvanica]